MKKLLILILIPFLFLFPSFAIAAESPGLIESYMIEITLGLVVIINIVVLLVLIVVLQAMKVLVRLNKPVEELEVEASAWQKFIHSMTDTVPVEMEEDILTDHAYDGIKELDNRLPPWWLYGFYFTIVLAIAYIGYYHVYKTGDLQAAEYNQEVAEAKEQIQAYLESLENNIDETNVELLTDANDLIFGQEAYNQNCVACHGSDGQGGVGPNLTDQYWIHGGDIKAIFKTIKNGVPQKGMISWQNKFTPKQMQQLSSFIISLEGTNPPNPKDAQGDLYERTEEEEANQAEKEEEIKVHQEQVNP